MLFFFSFILNLASGLIWIEPNADLDYNCHQNQAFQSEVGKTYYRLPPRAQNIVRSRVWQLSRHSASISIKFITNSSTLKVQYQREGPNSFAMMNQLGTSGIDLYGFDENGESHFFAGVFSFGSDVTTFNFNEYNQSVIFSYLLILPSYDVVKPSTLKIGYEEDSYFKIFPTELEKPITTYGTSIMHGACPNRPGLSWVNWFSRELQLPVHNFGFMGQGILEKEVINLVIEEKSLAFILDCLPNLVFDTVDKVVNLTIDAYIQIRAKWPDTPIILVEFGGYTNYEFSNQYRTYTDNMNIASKIAYERLKDEIKATNLYYIHQDDIGMTSDDISDPVHPMDNGMNKQKSAVVKALREILSMPVKPYSTQDQVMQHRNIDFQTLHQENLKMISTNEMINGKSKIIIGDNIISNWQSVGFDSWNKYMEKYINLGIGLDRIENVLYRIYHEEISDDYVKPESIVTLIGTNNIQINNQTEIVEGIKFLLQQMHVRQPDAKLILLGILPRADLEVVVKNINIELKKVADNEGWTFADPGQNLLNQDTGLINTNYFVDGINLNKNGYDVIAPIIAVL